jgi:hypothetical protein
MPSRQLATFLALCVSFVAVAVPTAATAGVPSWSTPRLLAPNSSPGDVGIDANGRVTAVWGTLGRRTFIAERAPGATAFGTPTPLDSQVSTSPKLAVNAAGGAAVIWDRQAVCDDFACQSVLQIRTRKPGGPLGAPQQLPASLGFPNSDVAVSGDDEAIVAWSTLNGGVHVARGPLGGAIGAVQQLATPEKTYDLYFSLATNARGDAVIAWPEGEQPDVTGIGLMASYRPAGGKFGPAKQIFRTPPVNMYDPSIATAVDGSGNALVGFSTSPGTLRIARGKGASWKSEPLARGHVANLISSEAGDLLAWWRTGEAVQNTPATTFGTRLAIAPAGKPLGAPIVVPGENGGTTLGGLDNLRNGLFFWSGPQPSQSLFAGTFSRFGLVDSQELGHGPAQPVALAVNGSGAAVALSIMFVDGTGSDLLVLDRPADESKPRTQVSDTKGALTAVTTEVTCNEPCRATASARLKRSRAGASARKAKGRTKLVRPGRRARLRVPLTRGQRSRARRALEQSGKARVTLTVRVEDAAGNRRIVKRRITLRR